MLPTRTHQVVNRLRIRGDDFHTRKNRPLPRMQRCCSCAFAVSSVWFYSPVQPFQSSRQFKVQIAPVKAGKVL
jgi:hypothetical protein